MQTKREIKFVYTTHSVADVHVGSRADLLGVSFLATQMMRIDLVESML